MEAEISVETQKFDCRWIEITVVNEDCPYIANLWF